MAGYHKMEKFIITEIRDGCIFKTQKVGFQWFRMDAMPKCYEDQGGYIWVNTDDYYFGPKDPRIDDKGI